MEARCEPEDVEVWGSEGSLQACRRGGMEVWSAGVAMRTRVGVATWRHITLTKYAAGIDDH